MTASRPSFHEIRQGHQRHPPSASKLTRDLFHGPGIWVGHLKERDRSEQRGKVIPLSSQPPVNGLES
ncbi:hypothetical protein JMJ77_0001038 [Colletotrichum scovillei]|uniref:Uncharacterized protein n=1 Tax=Colletotrichum scovillei TaxID=1209932 RepID=A0A9P7UHX0_9PEZI|nr:hypothetical protein JMJ77_0001038 [Colletotrichum scovillei]KAG7072258.1 hypothetical protein JMJ76_0005114 [Colletotrichum scovillei]KAG7080468.1 hypothetical protein JMJ78_0007562 [Colletotrichum scovillei]